MGLLKKLFTERERISRGWDRTKAGVEQMKKDGKSIRRAREAGESWKKKEKKRKLKEQNKNKK